MNLKEKPIGLFDSGMGGLTVLQELADLMPEENFVYFGDTARLPYGNKSRETIQQFAVENSSFLLKQQIKLLVIACHTACSHAHETLQKTLPIPVVGVTDPGIDQLLKTTKTNSVAILGTTSTIGSNIFQSRLLEKRPTLRIYPIACPLFVPLVEEGLHNHPATVLLAEHYLSSLRNTDVDTALLACTHYPLLLPTIQSVLGPSIQLITPAKACALQAKELLTTVNLLHPIKQTPTYRFYVSDDPAKFQKLGQSYFSRSIEQIFLAPNKIL